jgi:hypothetical protein
MEDDCLISRESGAKTLERPLACKVRRWGPVQPGHYLRSLASFSERSG